MSPADRSDSASRDAILDVVLELIEADGYDGVQLRVVAAQAHVSLSTIYANFGTRDELVTSAMERWRETNMYRPLAEPWPADEPVQDGLMRLYRLIFQPWERNPRMLDAFYRARAGASGERLEDDGRAVIHPRARAVFGDLPSEEVEDILAILDDVTFAAISRYTNGEIEIVDILPRIERAVAHLTSVKLLRSPSAHQPRTQAP